MKPAEGQQTVPRAGNEEKTTTLSKLRLGARILEKGILEKVPGKTGKGFPPLDLRIESRNNRGTERTNHPMEHRPEYSRPGFSVQRVRRVKF